VALVGSFFRPRVVFEASGRACGRKEVDKQRLGASLKGSERYGRGGEMGGVAGKGTPPMATVPAAAAPAPAEEQAPAAAHGPGTGCVDSLESACVARPRRASMAVAGTL